MNKYKDTSNHLGAFILDIYKLSDRYHDDVDFEHYLSVTKGLSNNTSMKYIGITKRIFRLANKRGRLPANPVATFSCSFSYGEPTRLELH